MNRSKMADLVGDFAKRPTDLLTIAAGESQACAIGIALRQPY